MRLVCVTDNCVTRGSHLWGEHGLCFWIETPEGNMLWDTGQTPEVLEHNLKQLGLAGQPIRALGLSHAHYDHSWRAKATFSLTDAPQEIVPGVRTTGRIAPRPYPAGASPSHVVRGDTGFMLDPYADDMSLVLQVPGGVALLCGCCHAGLRNTLGTLRAQTDAPLLAIIGGTHLADAPEDEFRALIDLLLQEHSPSLYLNHCTGERPLYALRAAFGERVHPCPAGTTLAFE